MLLTRMYPVNGVSFFQRNKAGVAVPSALFSGKHNVTAGSGTWVAGNHAISSISCTPALAKSQSTRWAPFYALHVHNPSGGKWPGVGFISSVTDILLPGISFPALLSVHSYYCASPRISIIYFIGELFSALFRFGCLSACKYTACSI